MKYIAAVCGSSKEIQRVKDQLLQSNPVLERCVTVRVFYAFTTFGQVVIKLSIMTFPRASTSISRWLEGFTLNL